MSEGLRSYRVLEALAYHAVTDRGQAAALGLQPAHDVAEAQVRLSEVAEAELILRGTSLPRLPPRLDVGEPLNRAGRGAALDGSELAALGSLARAGRQNVRLAQLWPPEIRLLRGHLARMPDLELVGTILADSLDEAGTLLDTASSELARLRQEVFALGARLRRRIESLVKETDAAGLLQDDYYTLRDDRYVLPVVASQKRTLSGIIHGVSQTGATVYVEPQELVEANNQLALAHEAVRREERRILAELSQMCAEHSEELQITSGVLTTLDLRLAAGRLAVQLGAHRPQFAGNSALDAPALRHPILVLDGVHVVANAVRWSAPARWLVVSGPNGGGKTVVLSAVGLLVEMARLGLFVCASADTVLPWFDRVEVVLGDAQDIERGLSTFEGHLRRIAQVVTAAEQPGQTLILLDELATGTEPLAGATLATAILEHAMEQLPGAWGVVTTHFEALKLLALRNPVCVNAALELDARSLTPTFRLTLGHMGTSNPLALAARLGMPPSIVHRAEQLMGTGGSEVMQLLDRLQAERQALVEAQQGVVREQKQLENSRQLLDDQRQNEQRAIDRRIERATADMGKQLQTIAQELTQARHAAQSADKKRIDEATKVVAHRQVEVEHQQRAALARLGGKVEREPLQAAQLQVGSVAWHLGLDSRVEVIDVAPKGDRFKVRAGGLELWATMGELATSKPTDRAPLPKTQAKSGAQSRQPSDSTSQPRNLDEGAALLRQPDATVDVRGMRAEEAVTEVDRHLDKMILSGRPGACIVHGHGTGALRDAIRSHLRRHPHVAHSRPGAQGEGGDGATLVWLTT